MSRARRGRRRPSQVFLVARRPQGRRTVLARYSPCRRSGRRARPGVQPHRLRSLGVGRLRYLWTWAARCENLPGNPPALVCWIHPDQIAARASAVADLIASAQRWIKPSAWGWSGKPLVDCALACAAAATSTKSANPRSFARCGLEIPARRSMSPRRSGSTQGSAPRPRCAATFGPALRPRYRDRHRRRQQGRRTPGCGHQQGRLARRRLLEVDHVHEADATTASEAPRRIGSFAGRCWRSGRPLLFDGSRLQLDADRASTSAQASAYIDFGKALVKTT